MHDIITSFVVSQEIDRTTREQKFRTEDPDSLYRYEIWDSIGAAPSLGERLQAFIARFRRPAALSTRAGSACEEVPISASQCVPQC